MKKILIFFGIGLLVLIVGITVVVGIYIGPIIKFGVESVGPKIARVPIKVEAVNLSILTGTAQVKGLMVGNPQGYNTPQSISVGNVAVSVDPFSVMSSKIVVRSVQVQSPEITFEGGFGGNNLSKILSNVNAVSQASGGGEAASNANAGAQSGASGGKPAPKIEIDDFLITGAKAHVNLTGMGSKEMTIPLPDIHLTDLGKDSGGLTPAQLASAIFSAISADTLKAVSGAASQVGHGLENIGKEAGTTAQNSLSSVTKSISNIFSR